MGCTRPILTFRVHTAQSAVYLCNCLDNDLRGHTLRTNPNTHIKQMFEADLTADVKSLLVMVESKLFVAYSELSWLCKVGLL